MIYLAIVVWAMLLVMFLVGHKRWAEQMEALDEACEERVPLVQVFREAAGIDETEKSAPL